MQTVRDIWNLDVGQLMEWEEILESFKITPEDRPFWRQLLDSFLIDWSCKLRIGVLQLRKGKWLGIFSKEHSSFLLTVFRVPLVRLQLSEAIVTTINRSIDSTFYSVERQLLTLHYDMFMTSFMKPWDDCNLQLEDLLNNI